jgi:hypothetical protein
VVAAQASVKAAAQLGVDKAAAKLVCGMAEARLRRGGDAARER